MFFRLNILISNLKKDHGDTTNAYRIWTYKDFKFFLQNVQDCPFPLTAAGLNRVYQEDQS